MAAPARIIQIAAECPFKIKKLKVRKGQDVSKGTLLCLYTTDTTAVQKFKSCHGGTINNIHVKEGQDVEKGDVMFTLEGCTHPTVMKDMCASCGVDLRLENSTAGNRKADVTASVAMVHSIPELIVSEQMAQKLGKADQDRLLSSRKLVLLVDLDQTIIHTTMDNVPANLKGVKHFQLWHGNQTMWHHTKFRPGTQKFLEEISKLFELHICTFGSRMYAHTIAKILDPEGKFFSYRILSRDECFDASLKTANLKALFPCGDSMVCIIDDREDVWNYVPNMVHVKPYKFFEGTADINAPPGLAKPSDNAKDDTEDDTKGDSKDNTKGAPTEYKGTGDSYEEHNKTAGDNSRSEGSPAELKTAGECNKSSDGNLGSDVNENDLGDITDKPEMDKGDSEEKMEVNEADNDNDKLCETLDSAPVATLGDVKAEQSETSADAESIKDGPEAMETTVSSTKPCSDDKNACENDKIKCNLHNEAVDKNKEVMDSESLDITENKSVEVPQNNDGVKQTSVEEGQNTEKYKSHDKINITEDGDLDSSENKNTPNTDKDKGKVSESGKQLSDKDNKTKSDKDDDDEWDDEIEWDDGDDYLFYLEDVLRNIHKAFYDMHDQMKEKNPEDEKTSPSLKDIIPYIKKKILKDCNIVFSGVIPTNMPVEKNRAYIMAVSLGANIQTEIKNTSNEKDPNNYTTHLIAARDGTSKVRTAIKSKWVKVVNLKWLWSCYERWEKVEEGLFMDISKKSDEGRDSPDPSKLAVTRKRKGDSDDDRNTSKKPKTGDIQVDSVDTTSNDDSAIDLNSASTSKGDSNGESMQGKFSSTYNPLYAFSDDDIALMDKEVEDEIDDGEESSEEEESRNDRLRKQVLTLKRPELESSSEDSMTGDMPRGWGLKEKMSPKWSSSDEDEKRSSPRECGPEYESETDQDKFENIMEAFGPITSSEDEYQESIGSVDDEMADAVMKEFLS